MGRDGTESTTTKASAMEADGKLNHVVSRDALAFVFRVGQTCVRKVKGVVKFVLRQATGTAWVDHVSLVEVPK